ncbi:hypothetical protein SCHPADRAFT_938698 [Schizopora paradoxa]|uniref:Uncharacterized protein n=1 Tax=Schizopora paradoxa TaxID=27342 RepID=A0A0H2SEK3_9AGAM|nr:hypothetical protein SCHPADRAFT_938698 [Schizopora paradoxa]
MPNDPHVYWRCHRSIEAYCTEKTDMLFKYLDVLFEDMTNFVISLEMTGEFPNTEAQRQASEKCSMLIHIHRMQLDVIRRATKKKQEDLDGLEKRRSSIIVQINDQFSFKPLPTLPAEIITQILRHLYWMEEATDKYGVPRETTLQRLIANGGANQAWKDLIRMQIPIVVASTGSIGESGAKGNVHLVGPTPKELSIQQLNGDVEDVLDRRSTMIFATLSQNPDMEELEVIRGRPWHSLVITSKELKSSSDLMKNLVDRFGRELAALDRLKFAPSDRYNVYDKCAPWDPGEVDKFVGPAICPSNLRIVSAPAGLLPSLRPILSSTVVLDIGISIDTRNPGADRMCLKTLLEGLQHYANTLMSVSLHRIREDASRWRRRRSPSPSVPVKLRNHTFTQEGPESEFQSHRISFPRLRQLRVDLPQSTVEVLFSVLDCPSLSGLSVAISGTSTGSCLLTTLIHRTFPKLASLFIEDDDLIAEYFDSLAIPDENDIWLLPLLDSIEVKIKASLDRFILPALVEIVLNRLKSTATKPIRSLRVTGHFMTFNATRRPVSEYLDTLKLFVPEVILGVPC